MPSARTQTDLSAAELAALTVASRKLDRDELEPGTYNVFRRLLIHGSITVGEDATVCAPADYVGILGYVLSTLSARTIRRLERELEQAPVFDEEIRNLAKELALSVPRDSISRRGSIKGAITVEEI